MNRSRPILRNRHNPFYSWKNMICVYLLTNKSMHGVYILVYVKTSFLLLWYESSSLPNIPRNVHYLFRFQKITRSFYICLVLGWSIFFFFVVSTAGLILLYYYLAVVKTFLTRIYVFYYLSFYAKICLIKINCNWQQKRFKQDFRL
jgi:hypothetical protein